MYGPSALGLRLLDASSDRKRGAMARILGLACVLILSATLLTACVERSEGADVVGGPRTSPSPMPLDPSMVPPDLRIAAPRELQLSRDAVTGERQIRFDSSIFNLGPGALELSGRHDPAFGRTIASQHMRTIDGETKTRVAGTFVFHPTHDHWHVEDFTSFELWTHTADGTLDRLLATTGKMSFCIWDSRPMATPPVGAPAGAVFERCPQDIQGLSVGWIDTYRARTPGQHLTIEGIPSGRYAVRSTVDPENHFVESNEGNNAVTVYVRLSAATIDHVAAP